jgi:hypothetical protein
MIGRVARLLGALKLGRRHKPFYFAPTHRSVVLPACQTIFDVIGDLNAHGCQLKQLVLDVRIVGLLGKLPIHGRLVP